MRMDELDFVLPDRLIATQPAPARDQARLMLIRRDTQRVTHHRVAELPDIPDLLRPGDLMVFNNTRVLPAYFTAVRIKTGGKITGLYLASGDNHWQVMLQAKGRLQPGERIGFDQPQADGAQLELIESTGPGQWHARLHSTLASFALLHAVGQPPLPPYIRKARRALGQPDIQPDDPQRYNTIFAQTPGSVAAPTASLHFTHNLLTRLAAAGVEQAQLTLHVGLGTFAPVRSETLEAHTMHHEWLCVPGRTLDQLKAARAEGRRIIPVGTTCVRALESLPNLDQYPPAPGSDFTCDTDLMIKPGFRFRYTDALMTNFHLPRSTLLALVAALPGVGIENLLRYYQLAIDNEYRFYSYGDATFFI